MFKQQIKTRNYATQTICDTLKLEGVSITTEEILKLVYEHRDLTNEQIEQLSCDKPIKALLLHFHQIITAEDKDKIFESLKRLGSPQDIKENIKEFINSCDSANKSNQKLKSIINNQINLSAETVELYSGYVGDIPEIRCPSIIVTLNTKEFEEKNYIKILSAFFLTRSYLYGLNIPEFLSDIYMIDYCMPRIFFSQINNKNHDSLSKYCLQWYIVPGITLQEHYNIIDKALYMIPDRQQKILKNKVKAYFENLPQIDRTKKRNEIIQNILSKLKECKGTKAFKSLEIVFNMLVSNPSKWTQKEYDIAKNLIELAKPIKLLTEEDSLRQELFFGHVYYAIALYNYSQADPNRKPQDPITLYIDTIKYVQKAFKIFNDILNNESDLNFYQTFFLFKDPENLLQNAFRGWEDELNQGIVYNKIEFLSRDNPKKRVFDNMFDCINFETDARAKFVELIKKYPHLKNHILNFLAENSPLESHRGNLIKRSNSVLPSENTVENPVEPTDEDGKPHTKHSAENKAKKFVENQDDDPFINGFSKLQTEIKLNAKSTANFKEKLKLFCKNKDDQGELSKRIDNIQVIRRKILSYKYGSYINIILKDKHSCEPLENLIKEFLEIFLFNGTIYINTFKLTMPPEVQIQGIDTDTSIGSFYNYMITDIKETLKKAKSAFKDEKIDITQKYNFTGHKKWEAACTFILASYYIDKDNFCKAYKMCEESLKLWKNIPHKTDKDLKAIEKAIKKVQEKLNYIKEKMKENPFNAIDPDNFLEGSVYNPNCFFTDHDKINDPFSEKTSEDPAAVAEFFNN